MRKRIQDIVFVELSKGLFESQVVQSENSSVLIFSQKWQQIDDLKKEVVEGLPALGLEKLNLFLVDVDIEEYSVLANNLNLQSFPVLVFFEKEEIQTWQQMTGQKIRIETIKNKGVFCGTNSNAR